MWRQSAFLIGSVVVFATLIGAVGFWSSVPAAASSDGRLFPSQVDGTGPPAFRWVNSIPSGGMEMADLEAVSKDISGLPPVFPVDERVEFAVTEEVANRGPAGPVLAQVFQVVFPPDACQLSFHVTEELLAPAQRLEVIIDNEVVAVDPAAGAVFQADPGEAITIGLQVLLDAGQTVALNESWDTLCAQPGNYSFEFVKVVLPVDDEQFADPDPDNNEVERLFSVSVGDADLAAVSKQVTWVPGVFPPGEPVQFTVVEEVANFGPAGPVLTEAFQVLFPPEACQVTFHATEELLSQVERLEVTIGGQVVAVDPEAGAVFQADPGEAIAVGLQVLLDAGQTVALYESWDTRCAGPGAHEFEFVKVVLPVDDEHVVDPNPDNNELEKRFNLEPIIGVCGDQNDDSVVDIRDVVIDLQIMVGQVAPTERQQILSDLNRDGSVNVFDAIKGLQQIVRLIAPVSQCGALEF